MPRAVIKALDAADVGMARAIGAVRASPLVRLCVAFYLMLLQVWSLFALMFFRLAL